MNSRDTLRDALNKRITTSMSSSIPMVETELKRSHLQESTVDKALFSAHVSLLPRNQNLPLSDSHDLLLQCFKALLGSNSSFHFGH